jgi:dsDNA-specific endonuclease/ATPase MutS2
MMQTTSRSSTATTFETSDARAAEMRARERELAAREQLLDALERRLRRSRRRLEQRLQAVRDRRSLTPVRFGLPRVPDGYFQPGSDEMEDAWWSQQLGKRPRIAA